MGIAIPYMSDDGYLTVIDNGKYVSITLGKKVKRQLELPVEYLDTLIESLTDIKKFS